MQKEKMKDVQKEIRQPIIRKRRLTDKKKTTERQIKARQAFTFFKIKLSQ